MYSNLLYPFKWQREKAFTTAKEYLNYIFGAIFSENLPDSYIPVFPPTVKCYCYENHCRNSK